MKRILLLALVSIVVVSLAVAQEKNAKPAAPKSGNAQEEIKKLELERNQAIVHSDRATLDRMTSEDYILINARGEVLTKAQILESFKSGATKFESRELSDLSVRVYGNAAVVTGHITQKATELGKDTKGEYLFTRVYMKEKGRWISVTQQVTAAAKK